MTASSTLRLFAPPSTSKPVRAPTLLGFGPKVDPAARPAATAPSAHAASARPGVRTASMLPPPPSSEESAPTEGLTPASPRAPRAAQLSTASPVRGGSTRPAANSESTPPGRITDAPATLVEAGHHAGEMLLQRYLLLQRVEERPGVTLWRAREMAHGADVTVRIVEEANGSPRRPGPAYRRARAAAQLKDETLVKVLDVDLTKRGETVIVTETTRGVTLAQLLRARGTLGPDEAVALLLPVAIGLGEAHAAELVHGSVTMDDILVRSDGRGAARATLVGLATTLPSEGEAHAAAADPHLDIRALARALRAVIGDEPAPDARLDELRATLDRGMVDGARGWQSIDDLAATLGSWAKASARPSTSTSSALRGADPFVAQMPLAPRRMVAPMPRFTRDADLSPRPGLLRRAPRWLLVGALAALAMTAASLAARPGLMPSAITSNAAAGR